VFCRPDQVADEAARALRSALRAQEILGLPVDYVRLSRRDDSPVFLGAPEQWAAAEVALLAAAEAVGLLRLLARLPWQTARHTRDRCPCHHP